MPTEPFDPINEWFRTGEELGEYIGIRFGRIAPGAMRPEWFSLTHTAYDGIGGFAELLRRAGADLPRLPRIRHPSPPSVGPLIRSLPGYLKPRRRVKWGLKPEMAGRRCSGPPPAIAWHLFDEHASTQIRLVCRKGGITVNSFLLKNLTKAIRPYLDDQSSVVPWMIPVNLRGKFFRERDTANHTSYVGVRVQSFETVYDVHRSIYAALARGEHWANWYAYYSSRFLSARVRRFLVVKERAMVQWNLGSFSNLGDWDRERLITQEGCLGGWLFCPPVLKCQLVGAGAVTFQNRLGLAIQAHPDLTTDPSIPELWIQHWVKEIEIDVASGFAEPSSIPWSFAGSVM